jgi:MFS family permease
MLRLTNTQEPKPQPQTLREGLQDLRQVVLYDRAFMFFQLAFFLSGSAFFMSTHITLKLAHERLGFDAAELSLWLSVLPQVLLALCSPLWGLVLDRIGIVRARLLISVVMTGYLACYFGGIDLGLPALLVIGSVLRGVSEGGGQVTWALASVHFAPESEDVPLYNGIHFVLNGIRGLVMPWVGSLLFLFCGPWTILIATVVSAGAILVIGRSLRYGNGPDEEAVIRPLPQVESRPKAAAGAG